MKINRKRKVLRQPYRCFYRVGLLSATALVVSLAALAGSLAANLDRPQQPQQPPPQAVEALPSQLQQAPVLTAQEPQGQEPESLGEFWVSAYCPCPACCGIWSAQHPSRIGTGYIQRTISGTIPKAGRTVGVDPAVIPLGTHILVDGQEYVAEDAGASQGNVVEIYFDSHEEALAWPMGKREVYLA